MSDMPARTLSEAEQAQQTRSHERPQSNAWIPYPGSTSSSSTTGATAGRLNLPPKRQWKTSPQCSIAAPSQDLSEEDELSDESAPRVGGIRTQGHMSVSKRKDGNPNAELRSPKRSKRADSKLSPKETRSRSLTPYSRTSTATADRAEVPSSGQTAERLLSFDEVDTFLDLIYKHHPEPMTAENMRQSVDALYRDWEQYCSRRQVPVTLAKKPLMDEYGKVFNGVYGPDYQAKAKSIAQELSQRAQQTSTGDASTHETGDQASTRSQNESATDDDSDEEEADGGDTATAGDAEVASAPRSVSKKAGDAGQGPTESGGGGSSKKSNIAQVGRNGLAVLPPGLFDILRNHLRDDILSSIMPSVRNDLTEQTRELLLQHQDLFARIKELEERIRNQDLWIRHLLSQDPVDVTTAPIGVPMGAPTNPGVEPTSDMMSKARPFAAHAREGTGQGRHLRQIHSSVAGEPLGGPPASDYFGGKGPTSPRQPPLIETRPFIQQGMTGPHPWEGRSPTGVADPAMAPGPASVPIHAFGSGRWEGEGPPPMAYRDRPLTDRRTSYPVEFQRRPSSWQSEAQSGRGFAPSHHPGDHMNVHEGRHEPPFGAQHGDSRFAFGERRRMSAMGSGPSGPFLPPPPTMTAPAPTIGSMQDEFRRPGPPMHPRDQAMSPVSPAYDIRQAHPARAGSPVQVQKNKRGRPSKVEMANSRAEMSSGSRGPYSGALPRPYLP